MGYLNKHACPLDNGNRFENNKLISISNTAQACTKNLNKYCDLIKMLNWNNNIIDGVLI